MARILLFCAILVVAFSPACRGREERSLVADRNVRVTGGPASGEPERAGLSAAAQRGRAAYVKSCASCHGLDGRGQTQMGRMLRAGNLASPATHARLSDASIAELVRSGKGRMPAFTFDAITLKDVIAYVRTLKRGP